MDPKINIEVVTSFNQTYHDRIGRDCVRSYLDHWSTPLTVYAEECNVVSHDRLKVIDFHELGDNYRDFQQDSAVSRRCKTFAKKAFCVIHAMYHSSADWLIWLDADVLTKRSDPAEILAQVLHQKFLAMYMGVIYTEHKGTNKHGRWLVPETGLFGVNLKHSSINQFREEYQRHYVKRDFNNLRRSYDNDVFGAVISHLPAQYLDLCESFTKPYKTPLKHTVFGEYLHHYKAKHSKQHYVDCQ